MAVNFTGFAGKIYCLFLSVLIFLHLPFSRLSSFQHWPTCTCRYLYVQQEAHKLLDLIWILCLKYCFHHIFCKKRFFSLRVWMIPCIYYKLPKVGYMKKIHKGMATLLRQGKEHVHLWVHSNFFDIHFVLNTYRANLSWYTMESTTL